MKQTKNKKPKVKNKKIIKPVEPETKTEEAPEPETPTQQIETTPANVPQKKRKERADKGKARGKKISDDDIILNMKFTLIMATTLIAKQMNNPRVVMLDKEAENFDKAIDKLIIYYLPTLKKHPIALLIAPTLEYIARVSIETAIDKNAKTKQEVPVK